MKYLVLLLIALVVLWRLRSNHRGSSAKSSREQAPETVKVAEMQACRHCGLHVPLADMVAGVHGHYCCAEHRTAAER